MQALFKFVVPVRIGCNYQFNEKMWLQGMFYLSSERKVRD